ncbi:MAG: sigma-54-dependent Fis family transcriptional regulator, partial [Deltaproteobacteria bacterium]|nr:sigma-54-dependent Fis family transcriptional regulator [Deltaproteobacteria bacterium]
LHRDEPLRFDDLAASSPRPTANGSSANDSQSLELDEVNAKHITRVLEMTGGKIHGPGGAGEILGVNPSTLRYKIQKLGIQNRKSK